MEQDSKAGMSKWVWIIVAIVVVVGLVLAWYFLMGPGKKAESSTEAATTQAVAKAPQAGWEAYTSTKYNYTVNHPTTYVVETTGDMSVKFKKDGKVIADISATTGGTSADYDATIKLYTDATKGYMTGGVATPVRVAGTDGKKVTGTFGKNGGITMGANDGVKGSVVIFTMNDRTYRIDSYDAADATAVKNFDTMISEMSF